MNKVKETVLAKSTRAITSDYYRKESTPTGAIANSQNDVSLLEIVKQDPEIRGMLAILVNSFTKSGYSLLHKNIRAYNEAVSKLFKLRFKKKLRQIYWNLIIYKNVFIEIYRNVNNQPVSLNVIEGSVNIKPVITEFGEVIKYVQEDTVRGGTISWSPNNMIHIAIDELDSQIFGNADLETLKDIILDKQMVLAHIRWLFKTNQFRSHLHFKGQISPDDIEANIALIRESMKDRSKFLITTGQDDLNPSQITNPQELDYYIKILDYYRTIEMTALQIPPIIGGTIEGSNRSSAEIQARFVYPTTLKAFQIVLDEEINAELFPKLGITNVEIEHNTVDTKEDKDYVDLAMKFISAGADPKKVEEWLQKNGVDIPNDFFTPKIEEIKRQKEMGEKIKSGSSFPQNSNLQPSRQDRDNEATDRQTPDDFKGD